MPRGNPRTVQIRFNLTPEEAEQLDLNVAEAGAQSRSTFLRGVAIGPAWATKLPAWRELTMIRTELRRIGTNINQLAAQVNRSAKAGEMTEAAWSNVAKELRPQHRGLKKLGNMISDQLNRLRK